MKDILQGIAIIIIALTMMLNTYNSSLLQQQITGLRGQVTELASIVLELAKAAAHPPKSL